MVSIFVECSEVGVCSRRLETKIAVINNEDLITTKIAIVQGLIRS